MSKERNPYQDLNDKITDQMISILETSFGKMWWNHDFNLDTLTYVDASALATVVYNRLTSIPVDKNRPGPILTGTEGIEVRRKLEEMLNAYVFKMLGKYANLYKYLEDCYSNGNSQHRYWIILNKGTYKGNYEISALKNLSWFYTLDNRTMDHAVAVEMLMLMQKPLYWEFSKDSRFTEMQKKTYDEQLTILTRDNLIANHFVMWVLRGINEKAFEIIKWQVDDVKKEWFKC